ncbi:hypothetical protein DSM112329_02980 [Paraconexibacter sp. AEG42_29]|uniref:Uncharacterized protein n=1 Tax=Paraconexibacter sp. AEG42_29 TaxID=2997339 RepID=A0AAU7AXT5_9ACTN
MDRFNACIRLWYPEDHVVDSEDVLDEDLDRLLLREASVLQPADPYWTVLGAVARELAQADWRGVAVPTEDFVVYVAEHDEGVAAKAASVRAHNPPGRVAAWDASWPAGVARDDED